MRAWLELLDAVYPPRCRLCGAAAADALACPAHALPAAPPGARCRRCARELPAGFPDGATCAGCRRDPPPFARTLALGEYRADAALREWVLALKHGGRADLATPLGTLLAERLAAAAEVGGARLVPVPLHPLRRLERGHDQAARLARAAAARLGLALLPALVRTRATPPQGSPGAPARRPNVRGAFRVDADAARPLAGARVWLVDDVVTSGATAAEAARALLRVGARSVGVLCLARA